MPATYEPIATTTLSSSASSITFSSIAATYTDLRLAVYGIASSGNFLSPGCRFNSDTGSNYSYTSIYGDGSTAGSTRTTSSTSIGFNTQNSITSTTGGFLTADVFSYAGSTNKTVLTTASVDLNGSGEVERIVGLWRNTAAITTLTLNGSFGAGTTATLYGILKA
jgi:hypothetical protein